MQTLRVSITTFLKMNRPIVLVGDIHGEFHILHDKILSGCDVYQVGDFGLGFRTQENDTLQMEALNKFGRENDINYFAIRGNHDNPLYWLNPEINEGFNETYSNIELIPDYSYKILNNKKTLFIGGAISVDRAQRIEGVSYWRDEVLQTPNKPLESCDMVISHTCPSYFLIVKNEKGDIVDLMSRRDTNLIQDLLDEREFMDKILHEVEPKEWFFGHFHIPKSGFDQGVKWRCLTINEKLQIEQYSAK